MKPEQPLNAYGMYGKPVRGMVLITNSPLVKRFRGRVSVVYDLQSCREAIAGVLEVTERLLKEGSTPTREEIGRAHRDWAFAVVAYGRCFLSADGRAPLTVREVKDHKGTDEAHELLMDARHRSAAHVALERRRIEVFANFKSSTGSVVTNLAVIESYEELPDGAALRLCVSHLDALIAGLNAELHEMQAHISRQLNEHHLVELSRHLTSRMPWA